MNSIPIFSRAARLSRALVVLCLFVGMASAEPVPLMPWEWQPLCGTVSTPGAQPMTSYPVTVAPSNVPLVVAPMAGMPVYSIQDQAYGSMDRLIAAATSSEEIRALLSRPERLRLVQADALLQKFLIERFAAPELTASSGLTAEYRKWLVETVIQHGDRLDATFSYPNFVLLPSVNAASWGAVWNRAYAPYIQALQSRWGGQWWGMSARIVPPGSRSTAAVRASATAGGRIVERLSKNAMVTVVGQEGSWYQVRSASGLSGFLPSSQVALIHPHAAPNTIPYRGAESVTLWSDSRVVAQTIQQVVPAPVAYVPVPTTWNAWPWAWQGQVPTSSGYYSEYGWVQPQAYQITNVPPGR